MDDYGNLTYFTPTPDAKDTIILYGQMVSDLFATGSNIRWYSDKKLLYLVHTGNEFTTGKTEIGDYTYYVTQTLSGCESAANAVSLSIWLEIPQPLGHDTVIMEGSGRMSFIPKVDYRMVQTGDLKLVLPQEQVLANLIIDGKIMREHLEAIGKSEAWLIEQLQQQRTDLNHILLATYSQMGILKIYLKNEGMSVNHCLE